MQIRIHNNYPEMEVPHHFEQLARRVAEDEKMNVRDIDIILVKDEYLKKLHRDFLNDDSYTDVMSFNLSDDERIEGEIYISLDRARINAREFDVSFACEMARLIIHGILHLNGYEDNSEAGAKQMRRMEEHYIRKYFNMSDIV